MKTLALRIYLAVVAVLLTFALVAGWLAQRNFEHERQQVQSQSAQLERIAAWAELIENSLPDAAAPYALQRQVLLDWSARLRLPMALDDPLGHRIAVSPLLEERLTLDRTAVIRLQRVVLNDGRSLWLLRPPTPTAPPPGRMTLHPPPHAEPWLPMASWLLPPGLTGGATGLLVMLMVLFLAVSAAAWPVADRLTRRLRVLRESMEKFGHGQLTQRVEVEGKDEVADVARSFNETAQRIEDLVNAHRSLLANASHELRSPLARMKMALSLLHDTPTDKADELRREIHQDIAELDSLVEEVLLASRLDARPDIDVQSVDLVGLLTEEARRVNAEVHLPADGSLPLVNADERLLRRAVRNLLENARRYGRCGNDEPRIDVRVEKVGGGLDIAVEDRGPGIPEDQRECIFEPFYRMPGHAEYAGGVGLGLSLVKQIALRHAGSVRVEARNGGGSRFVLRMPTR